MATFDPFAKDLDGFKVNADGHVQCGAAKGWTHQPKLVIDDLPATDCDVQIALVLNQDLIDIRDSPVPLTMEALGRIKKPWLLPQCPTAEKKEPSSTVDGRMHVKFASFRIGEGAKHERCCVIVFCTNAQNDLLNWEGFPPFLCKTRAIQNPGSQKRDREVQAQHFESLTVTEAHIERLTCSSLRTTGQDYAETFTLARGSQSIPERSVVGIDKHGQASLMTKGATRIGVVSENPSLCGGLRGPSKVVVVLCGWPGKVAVQVNGRVFPGDVLTPSGNNDGRAVPGRSSRQEQPVIGTVIAVDARSVTVLLGHPIGNVSNEATPNASSLRCVNAAVTGALVGAVGVPIAAVPVVQAIGFTAAGITARSTAAWMMSRAAIRNGGSVASRSAVAMLQSLGAAGLGTLTGPAVVAGTVAGGLIGTCAYLIYRYFTLKEKDFAEMTIEEKEAALMSMPADRRIAFLLGMADADKTGLFDGMSSTTLVTLLSGLSNVQTAQVLLSMSRFQAVGVLVLVFRTWLRANTTQARVLLLFLLAVCYVFAPPYLLVGSQSP